MLGAGDLDEPRLCTALGVRVGVRRGGRSFDRPGRAVASNPTRLRAIAALVTESDAVSSLAGEDLAQANSSAYDDGKASKDHRAEADLVRNAQAFPPASARHFSVHDQDRTVHLA